MLVYTKAISRLVVNIAKGCRWCSLWLEGAQLTWSVFPIRHVIHRGFSKSRLSLSLNRESLTLWGTKVKAVSLGVFKVWLYTIYLCGFVSSCWYIVWPMAVGTLVTYSSGPGVKPNLPCRGRREHYRCCSNLSYLLLDESMHIGKKVLQLWDTFKWSCFWSHCISATPKLGFAFLIASQLNLSPPHLAWNRTFEEWSDFILH